MGAATATGWACPSTARGAGRWRARPRPRFSPTTTRARPSARSPHRRRSACCSSTISRPPPAHPSRSTAGAAPGPSAASTSTSRPMPGCGSSRPRAPPVGVPSSIRPEARSCSMARRQPTSRSGRRPRRRPSSSFRSPPRTISIAASFVSRSRARPSMRSTCCRSRPTCGAWFHRRCRPPGRSRHGSPRPSSPAAMRPITSCPAGPSMSSTTPDRRFISECGASTPMRTR